jgi:hypothetical protein
MEPLESVVVSIPAGGGRQTFKEGAGVEQVRLRRFWGTTDAAGIIRFEDTDETALTGDINLVASGGFIDLGDQNIENSLITAAGKGLVLYSSVGFGGFAKISRK